MEIKLTNCDNLVKVSQKDYDKLSIYKWHKNTDGYACGTINKQKILMHRFIINPTKNELVDHINGNKLDNTQENLRISTYQKNGENKKEMLI